MSFALPKMEKFPIYISLARQQCWLAKGAGAQAPHPITDNVSGFGLD
jgi:hypothetical protein